MKILYENPPNIEAIRAAFPTAIGKVVYAYGDTIYNPDKFLLEPQNLAHEEVHEKQQEKIGVQTWWHAYIADPEFRAEQELPAYREEYRVVKQNKGREEAAKAARRFATALSGPNYGECVSFRDALSFITGSVI